MARQGLWQVNVRRRIALALLASPALAGCEKTPPAPPVTVRDAIVQLPAVPGRPGVAYFTIETGSDPAKLIGVGSPGLGRVELHATTMADGMASMASLADDQRISSPDKPLVFEPGGKHAMIYDMPRTLKPGTRIPLTFTFRTALPVTVWADVRAVGGAR